MVTVCLKSCNQKSQKLKSLEAVNTRQSLMLYVKGMRELTKTVTPHMSGQGFHILKFYLSLPVLIWKK